MATYKIWAFWDDYRKGLTEFTNLTVCSDKPERSVSGSAFYHTAGKNLLSFSMEGDKLDFINKVCWLEPGECKEFEIEVD